MSDGKRCVACKERKPRDEFPQTSSRKCSACHAAKPPRMCHRCGETKPADDFVYRGRACAACRATPPPSMVRPRKCFRCMESKPPEAFPWGDGSHGRGVFKRRRQVCQVCLDREAADREMARAARRASLQTWEEDGVLVRRCSMCSEVKPLAENFYRDGRRGADGSVMYGYKCKPCAVAYAYETKKRDPEYRRKATERQREWARRNPEKVAEAQRRYREKLKRDPGRHAAKLEAERIAHRLRRERADGVHVTDIRAARPMYAVRDERHPVPTGQLVSLVERYAADHEMDLGVVCEAIGLNERQLWAWREGERPSIDIGPAERVLTYLNLLWWDVWNEDTVRRPLVLVRTYRFRLKRGRNGMYPVWESGERHYGDAGPDTEALEAIERAWEGDRQEVAA